jgi:hypothetical protein
VSRAWKGGGRVRTRSPLTSYERREVEGDEGERGRKKEGGEESRRRKRKA